MIARILASAPVLVSSVAASSAVVPSSRRGAFRRSARMIAVTWAGMIHAVDSDEIRMDSVDCFRQRPMRSVARFSPGRYLGFGWAPTVVRRYDGEQVDCVCLGEHLRLNLVRS
jgi:hypothetical protein